MIKKFTLLVLLISSVLTFTAAKEPTNIMIGIGAGYGNTSIGIHHSHAIRNPIYNWSTKPGGQFNQLEGQRWVSQQDSTLQSWALGWEFLIGYKTFINDYVGFRAYANIGVQHYKPTLYESKSDPIGLIDYTINTDLLINFYESQKFSIGILGGAGFGGLSFAPGAVDKYIYAFTRDSLIPVKIKDIQKHFWNLTASAGIRATVFQKIRHIERRTCEDYDDSGKRKCRVPVSFIGHSLELNAKFGLLPFNATQSPDIIEVSTGKFASRPKYQVKNPYRITLRYIIDF